MTTLTASEARANLYRLNAVLVAEEDWRAIQEPLFLLSAPNMREHIKAGMAEATDTCATELD